MGPRVTWVVCLYGEAGICEVDDTITHDRAHLDSVEELMVVELMGLVRGLLRDEVGGVVWELEVGPQGAKWG